MSGLVQYMRYMRLPISENIQLSRIASNLKEKALFRINLIDTGTIGFLKS